MHSEADKQITTFVNIKKKVASVRIDTLFALCGDCGAGVHPSPRLGSYSLKSEHPFAVLLVSRSREYSGSRILLHSEEVLRENKMFLYQRYPDHTF
jgi:hypothetical protein